MSLPERTGDTMGEAIALSSPSGRMSGRSRKAAQERLGKALFGDYIPAGPKQWDAKEKLLHRAKYLRDLASHGMSVRKFTKEADKLEAEAARMQNPGKLTIYQALVYKLGRVPTNAELKADVDRIKREAYVEAAGKGKLRHQRGRNPDGADSSVRSPTRTSSEVRSPTSTRTRTEVRSPTSTSTSTRAKTHGNFTATVTGGAGAGANTTVHIHPNKGKRNPGGRDTGSEDGDVQAVSGERLGNPSDYMSRPLPQSLSDIGQAAFEAGKDWRLSGAYNTSGVANARVVRYGFIKWWNDRSPVISTPAMNKAAESGFREGWEAGKRVERKGNPEGGSESMYSSFHGTPSTSIDEYEEQEHYHSNLAALGELVGLKVRTVSGYDVTLGFESSRAINPRKEAKKRGRGFWPFNSFTHSTIYHVGAGKTKGTSKTKEEKSTAPKYRVVGEFKGYKIEKQAEGYVAPKVDPSVFFDSKDDVKLFIISVLGGGKLKANPLLKNIVAWRKSNPGPFNQSGQFVSSLLGAMYAPVNKLMGTGADMLDRGLGAVGVKNPGREYAYPEESRLMGSIAEGEMILRSKRSPGLGKKMSVAELGAVQRSVDNSKRRLTELQAKNDATYGKKNPTKQRSNPDHVLLCSTEDGANLQLIGGDQSLDLDALKIDGPLADKELVTIGEVWGLNYRTEKTFGDGGSEDGLTEYIHILGPKETKPPRGGDLWQDAIPPKDDVFGTGELPTLVYDKRNQKLTLSGGMYHINQPLMGTSAGIEN